MKKIYWKDIPGYENYQVSNIGEIKSLKIGKEIIMKQKLNNDGYMHISLYKNKKPKTFKVHQLVAQAFINDYFIGCGKVINHINGIKTDNRVKNLEIVTQRENCSTCTRSDRDTMSSQLPGASWNKIAKKWGSQIWYNGIRYFLGYFDTDKEASDKWYEAKTQIDNNTFYEYFEKLIDSKRIKVLQYSKSGEFIREWNTSRIASIELKINQGSICQCCRGRIKSAGGYVWEYKE